MVYITGDCHGDFRRFTKRQLVKLPFVLSEDDFVIVCGDFGLLWEKSKEFEYITSWYDTIGIRKNQGFLQNYASNFLF